jgi:sugar lactone lactonase YvrE
MSFPCKLAVSFLIPALGLAQTYTITTVAGGYPLISGIGDNGPATYAFLNAPGGVAVDAAGNIYIADTGDDLIRKVNTSGIITTIAGTNGSPGFSGDGGPAKSAKLHSPAGVGVDSAGNVYIADTMNNRIRKVDTNGNISTVAGSNNTFTTGVGDGGAATSASLLLPKGVAVDTAGNLYIADFGNFRVRKVTNGTITTVAGNGFSVNNAGATGDGGPATSGSVAPFNIALDSSGNIFIADSQDNLIRKVTASSGNISTVAGYAGYTGYTGDGGSAIEATLMNPEGVAVDDRGYGKLCDSRGVAVGHDQYYCRYGRDRGQHGRRRTGDDGDAGGSEFIGARERGLSVYRRHQSDRVSGRQDSSVESSASHADDQLRRRGADL